MMRTSISAALLSSVSFIGLAAAQQAEQVPPIEVNASQQQGVAVPDPQPAPVTSITPEGLSLMGGPAQTSSYQAADAVPSVLVESPDPYGLSPTRNISIRGKSDFHLSKNIEGLPIYGIVGGADLIDLENVQRLDVYRSSIPADKSLSISHATGLIDQRILGPQDKAGVFGRQAFGSDSFYKTFLRVDTGLNKDTGTKAFFSVSAAGADKWTGDGSQERRNFTFGVNQKVGDRLTIDVNGVYDQYQGNLWRALTYAQSLDLKTYGRYAYNTVLTGNPATDASYYGFNKGIYNNYATFAKVDYEVADGHHIVFRPYYWNDNGVQYSTSGTSVQKWNQNNDNLGGVLKYEGHFGKTTDVVTG